MSVGQSLKLALLKIGKKFFRKETEFCFLASHMKLHQHFGDNTGLAALRIYKIEQTFGIDALDEGCLSDELLHLVGLQMADEMPIYIRGELRNLFQQFLNPALA